MSYFRINDLQFDVPATDISVDHVNMTFEWPSTLRSRHRTKMKPGNGDVHVSVRLQVTNEELWKIHRLAVQFKYTPFWQIENQFIRDSIEPYLKVEQNMAFAAMGMTGNSIPGNPNLWGIDLSLKYFNYSPFMKNFQYKKDWLAEDTDGSKWTIYDQQIEPSPTSATGVPSTPTEGHNSEDRTISNLVKDYPKFKSSDNTVDVNDLNPLPYQHVETSAVDCHESNVYNMYCNKLMWEEMAELGMSVTAVAKDGKFGFDADPKTPPKHISYRSQGNVKFSWTEYVQINTNPEIAMAVMNAQKPVNNIGIGVTDGVRAYGNGVWREAESDALWLFPTFGPVTSNVGPRVSQTTTNGKKSSSDHKGTDVGVPIGTLVVAPSNLRIDRLQKDDGNGAGTRIWATDLLNPGYIHGFFHLDGFIPTLKKGDVVAIGDSIAYSGHTGNGTGPHLHWEVREGTQEGRAFDPIGLTAWPASQQAQLLMARANGQPRPTLDPNEVESSSAITSDEDSGDADSPKVTTLFENAGLSREALKADGWHYYRSPHIKNTWYRKHTLLIEPHRFMLDGHMIDYGAGNGQSILTGVGMGLENHIVSIPLIGHQYPTMQHLGGFDSRLMMAFNSVTDSAHADGISEGIKAVSSMVAMLETNARNFRFIPDSWTVEVETFIADLVGHRTYVVDRMRNDVSAGNPGLSNLEITFSSTAKKPEEQLMRANSINREQALREIVKILLSKMRIMIGEAREDVVPPVDQTITIFKKTSRQSFSLGDAKAMATENGNSTWTVVEKQVTIGEWQNSWKQDGWEISRDVNLDELNSRKNEVGKPKLATDKFYELEAGLKEQTDSTITDMVAAPKGQWLLVESGVESIVKYIDGYYVRYENRADTDDQWLNEKVNELIVLMQFASALLSDQYYGGYTRADITWMMNAYGLQRYILPCFELSDTNAMAIDHGLGGGAQVDLTTLLQALGQSPGLSSGGVLRDQLSVSVTPLTSFKLANRGLSEETSSLEPAYSMIAGLAVNNLLPDPLGIARGVIGGAGSAVGWFNDFLSDAGGLNIDKASVDSDVKALEQQAADGTSMTYSAYRRADSLQTVVRGGYIPDAEFMSEENQLIQRIENIFDQYFNIVWLGEQGQANAGKYPEFAAIFEQMHSAAMTSDSPAYPDLKLPGHPFFHGLEKASLYTFPDFYFYNPAEDAACERNSLDDDNIVGQVDAIIQNSYDTQHAFEAGTLSSLGKEKTADQSGAHFDGSDHSKSKKPLPPYNSYKEYKDITDQFNSIDGADEMRNNTSMFDANPSLDLKVSGDHEYSLNNLQSLARESLSGMQQYRGVMRRAFPTFKLFFIEEDYNENSWVALDDFYSYNAIRSITLTRSAKVPADLLIVEMQNVSGVLDGSLFGGVSDVDYLATTRDPNDPSSAEVLREHSRRPGFEGTSNEDFINSLVLREGMNIQLKLGYSNHADLLETVFNGRVVEVAWSENSDVVRIVCQNYAVELVQVEKGVTSEGLSGANAMDNLTLSYGVAYPNTAELLSVMIKSPEVLHFGRWKLGVASQEEESSDPGLDPKYYTNQGVTDFASNFVKGAALGALASMSSAATAGFTLGASIMGGLAGGLPSVSGGGSMASRRMAQFLDVNSSVFDSDYSTSDFERPFDSGVLDSARSAANGIIGDQLGGTEPDVAALGKKGISIKRFMQLNLRALNNAPQDDNIFAPHPNDYTDYGIFDSTGKITAAEISYHAFNTTIWDIFQEMTYRHPGWIAAPVPYGDRMTMFFGVPSQRYWSRPATIAFVERTKELRRKIKYAELAGCWPGAELISEYLLAIKLRFKPFRQYHLFTSYGDIVANNIAVSSYGVSNAIAVEYNSQGYISKARSGLGLINPDVRQEDPAFLEGNAKQTFLLKYHSRLPDEDAMMSTLSFENCNGVEQALRYALKGMCEGLKAMYKGSITVLGNAKIKPYDVGIIFDTYNGMSGPIEVEEVTHIFSRETGWISVVVPNALVIANETSSSPLLDTMMWASIYKAKEIADSVGDLGRPYLGNATPYAEGAAATIPGVAQGVGLYSAIAGLTAGYRFVARDETIVKDKVTGAISFKPIQTPVTLIPLVMHGQPLIAGIPFDLADTLWLSFKGKWTRYLHDVEAGYHEGLLAANSMGFNILQAYGPKMNLLKTLAVMGSQ